MDFLPQLKILLIILADEAGFCSQLIIFFFEEGTINDIFNIERKKLPGKSGFLV